MRNKLLATTVAMLVGMTLAAAQNMPNGAQSERGSAAAERQQQGRDAQRGAQEQRGAREQSKAEDKRRQSQRSGSEGREQRDQTTGQSSGSKEQSQRDQGMQGRSKQGDAKQRGEAQRDLTTGQSQREQIELRQRTNASREIRTQGRASQNQQPRSDRQQNQSQQSQSPAEQRKAQPNQANQGQPDQSQQSQTQPSQAQPNQAGQGQGTGNVTLTSEQRTRIQQTVLAGRNVPRVDNVNFALNVGIAVPATVRVVDVPPTLIEIYPQWRGHQYFVVRDEIVIVDRSRKIVATVPVGSSGGAAQLGGPGGGARLGTGINLSADEKFAKCRSP